MPTEFPVSEKARCIAASDVSRTALSALFCIGTGVFVVIAWMLPGPLVLPALSVLATLAALLASVLAWTRPRHPLSHRVTYWDLAGALTLIGACAALLSDPEAVIPLLESQRAQ